MTMYVYTLVVLLLCGLDVVSSRTSHSGIVSYTQHDHTRSSNTVQGAGDLQALDRLDVVSSRTSHSGIVSYTQHDHTRSSNIVQGAGDLQALDRLDVVSSRTSHSGIVSYTQHDHTRSSNTVQGAGDLQALDRLDVVSSRTSHSGIVSYTQGDHTHSSNTVQNAEASQKPDRCGIVALRCYEPILSYVDGDGEFCGWKNMTSFRELPDVCAFTGQFMQMQWQANALKYQYKFFKTCNEIKKFQHCVRNNQVCRKDYLMSKIMSSQNTYCHNLNTILPIMTCMNAWDSSVNWYKLLYTDWRIVQACPATHFRQLSLNSMKLFLFTYITYPSSWTDGVAQSLNAEAAGRHICQHIQQDLCLYKRADAVCSGVLPVEATQEYTDQDLIGYCYSRTLVGGKCNKFVKEHCPVNLSSGQMTVAMDYQNITNVYNLTYWRSVGNSEVGILLHTVNKGIGHCAVSNLIFKQSGCFHQFMTQMDINHANKGSYLSQYICSNIKIYSSCFETFVNSSCPDEAKQFQGIARFLHAQCGIFSVANRNVSCPILAVYSNVVFNQYSWFDPIMRLMQHYVTVIRCKQMNPAPPGWRDEALYNTDMFIRIYKSDLIKGEQSFSAANYKIDVISTVCGQEAAAVYKDYFALATGEQYYQFLNHVIKGLEYIQHLLQ